MIVGLLGPAGSGKSTAAAYLRDKFGAEVYAFADPLKEIVRRAFDLTLLQVYGSQADKEQVDPRYGVTPRWLMQRIGTEGVRDVLGADFWAMHCLTRITGDEIVRGHVDAVIEDVRFPNEAAAIIGRGGSVWRLHPRGATEAHGSEELWRQAPFTAEIPVSETLPEFYAHLTAQWYKEISRV